jgi:phosphate transport system permease protein
MELLLVPVGLLALLWVSVGPAPDLLLSFYGAESLQVLLQFTNDPISKSTMVVAIALGLAIAPSVYSLMEDAISGVPDSVRFASYALGATRLQTLQRVVFRMAMPGLVAAVMLGFGRAFGETMIVLMVTGNTPVANWDLLQGLRALTANLAIELPEADKESVHYRVLFLTACLLFVFTFIVNTLAEVLSQRIRRTTSEF